MGYIPRFVTREAIFSAKKEQLILQNSAKGLRTPIGAIRFSVEDTVEAFFEFFEKVGKDGWKYSGMLEDPDLPYGGVYVFLKKVNTPKKEDKQIIEEDKVLNLVEDKEARQINLDLSGEDYTKEELFNAPSQVVNEIIRRQQKVINSDKIDPDKNSDVIDELALATTYSDEFIAKEEISDAKVRNDLYLQYEKKYKGKKAVFRGKETQGFKDWLDREKEKYDPFYEEYNEETGLFAIKDEEETTEYKKWFRENKMKKV